MAAPAADNSTSASVLRALYLRTKALHVEAERAGIIRDLLRGDATRDGYALLMRNLHPAYCAMESGLAGHASSPILAEVAEFSLDRAGAIKTDLEAMRGPAWAEEIPLLDSATDYASAIHDASKDDGSRLIAHAYARYLGDLSGGQILQKLLARSINLSPDEMSFYDFSRFADAENLKSRYRDALDRAAARAPDPDSIVEEAAAAFTHNIALSWAAQAAANALPANTPS